MIHAPCPYCGAATAIRDSACIYGRSYGLALVCSNYPRCDSFVGCHRSTGLPKGTLANAELREARKQAHAAFDPLWREQHWNRREAYAWLSRTLSIQPKDCHIGMFNVEQCRAVVRAISTLSSAPASAAAPSTAGPGRRALATRAPASAGPASFATQRESSAPSAEDHR